MQARPLLWVSPVEQGLDQLNRDLCQPHRGYSSEVLSETTPRQTPSLSSGTPTWPGSSFVLTPSSGTVNVRNSLLPPKKYKKGNLVLLDETGLQAVSYLPCITGTRCVWGWSAEHTHILLYILKYVNAFRAWTIANFVPWPLPYRFAPSLRKQQVAQA